MRPPEAERNRLDDVFPGAADPVQYSYRGFILRCKPQPTPSGRFLAYVVILCHQRGLHTVGAVTADLPSFDEHIDAVCAGLAAGRKWVDLNCAAASSGGDEVDDDPHV